MVEAAIVVEQMAVAVPTRELVAYATPSVGDVVIAVEVDWRTNIFERSLTDGE